MTILFATALMVGCATTKSVMDSLVDRSIDDLTAGWGAPDSSIKRSDGGAAYTWITIYSDQGNIGQCRKTLVTDSSGKIVTWSQSGCSMFW
jgi:hypothetical protein